MRRCLETTCPSAVFPTLSSCSSRSLTMVLWHSWHFARNAKENSTSLLLLLLALSVVIEFDKVWKKCSSLARVTTFSQKNISVQFRLSADLRITLQVSKFCFCAQLKKIVNKIGALGSIYLNCVHPSLCSHFGERKLIKLEWDAANWDFCLFFFCGQKLSVFMSHVVVKYSEGYETNNSREAKKSQAFVLQEFS